MKKTLFVMLLMLMVAMLAVSVCAATEIGTASELAALMGTTNATTLGGDYVLTADIDLSGIANQKPIGSQNAPFTGTFDGAGHTVSGINIVDTVGYCGFFGKVSGATIKNLTVKGSIDCNKYFVGGLVGLVGDVSNETTLIENCVNYCTVKQHTNTATAVAGGIVGVIRGSDCSGIKVTVKDCVNYGDIKATKQSAGIVGRIVETDASSGNKYTITGCWNYGTADTNTNNDTAAGILGVALVYNSTTLIENCYNDASAVISSGYQTAGIVGVTYTYTAITVVNVENCVNLGSITARYNNSKTNAGGIVGCVGTSEGSAKGKTTIKNCFSGGSVSIVSAYASQAGMILGDFFAASAVDYSTGNCYDANATVTSGANTLVTKKVTDLADADQYPSTFDGVFMVTANGPLPMGAPHDCLISFDGDKCICSLCGEELLDVADGYILLETAEDVLLLMANASNTDALGYSYKLAKDIDLASAEGQNPIGNITTPFTGVFDGASYAISGIDIKTSGVSAGLFGHASGATVKNLTVSGEIAASGMIATSSTKVGTGAGGIVGTVGAVANKTTTIENCVNNCTVTVSGALARAGGIVGTIVRNGQANIDVAVTNCVNYGKISGTKHAGGIVGRQEDYKEGASGTTLIEGCINYGDVTVATSTANSDAAAGILGCSLAYGSATEIKNCCNLGDITGGYRIGGIVGIVYNYTAGSTALIVSCANMGAVSASYNYSTNSAGGILGTGAHSAETALGLTTVQNCFNAGDVTTVAERAANGGMIVGLVVAAGADGIEYLDHNNYYATAATITDGGNTNGGEEILAAKWCMEQGFAFTDEDVRTHFWGDATADATCLVCGVTRHEKHVSASTTDSVSEEATCISGSLSYDLCTVCYLRENVVTDDTVDPDNHVLAWDISGDAAVLACTRDPEKCTHTVDPASVNGIYVSDNGDNDALGLTADAPLASYTLAQEIAAKMGKDMTVYLVDTVTVAKRNYSANNTSTACFEEYPHTNKITVTSADPAGKATFVIPNAVKRYFLYGPTAFEGIKLTGDTAGTSSGGGDIRFFARGFALTIGEGIEMVDIAGKIAYSASNNTFGLSNTVNISDAKVYVFGGFQNYGLYEGVTNTSMNEDLVTNVTVLSGSYYAIVGGNYSTSTGSYPIDFRNVNFTVTLGDIEARYIAPFNINTLFSVNDSTANMHIAGKVSAVYMYRLLFDADGSGSGNTVNYFFHKDCAGMKVGDYPMVSKTADAAVNAYYATGAEKDPVAAAFHEKTVYYWNEYPTQGEKLNFVEWCDKYSRHDFVSGTCSFCGVKECTGSDHYIAWKDDGTGKCIAGCDHSVRISSYSGIYVSDNGKDGADGKTASTPIRSYTLAQKLAAKAGKNFTIYLVGTVTVELNKTSVSNTTNKNFEEVKHTNTITVTKGGSAKPTLVIPYSVRNYFLSGPTTFSNIKISGDTVGTSSGGGNVRFFGRGNNLTFGSGIEMVNLSGGSAISASKTDAGVDGFGATVEIPNSKVYVFGGFLHGNGTDGLQDGGESPTAFSSYLSISSGKYWAIVGGSYSDSADANPVTLDGATVRIGMSAFTARYLAPVNLNGKCSIDNTTVDIHYKGTAKVANAYRFIYSDQATGSGNTVNHFFYKGMKSSEIGDFGAGSLETTVAVNCYYATPLKDNALILGFLQKGDTYAEAYGQSGEALSFPEWCVERGGGHDIVDGICSFCEITPCTVHKTEWIVIARATCSAPGMEANRCTVCAEHIEERELPIDENAHDAAWVYGETAAEYICALCGAKAETVTYADLAASGEVHLSAAGSASGDATAERPVNDFDLAMRIAAAADTDVTVYIHDIATIFDNGNHATLLDYVEPAHENTITITSYGEGRAVLRFDDITFRTMSYNLSGPTVFKNIEISGWGNDKAIYMVARHNPLELGEGVSTDYQRKGGNSHSSAVYVVGGCYGTQNSADCGEGAKVTIRSGTYSYIYGGTLTGSCCTTGDIELNLLGNITVRNSIIAGNSGNNTYNGDSEDIYIAIDGHVTVGKFFAFSSSGENTGDANDPVPYTSQDVIVKIYGGTIVTESFRYGNAEAIRALGAAVADETATDRVESLTIFVNPTDNAARTMYNMLLDSLYAPIEIFVTEEEIPEDSEGEGEEGSEGEDDDENGDGEGGVSTGQTITADPDKFSVHWMDDTYCEVNNGEHTQGSLVDHLDPTCAAEGFDIYYCIACEKEYPVAIPKAPHTFGEAITIAATCIAPEMTRVVCEECGLAEHTVVGNTFAEHTDPEKTGFCQVCNLDLTANCEHEYGAGEPFKSGCGDGTKYTCNKCGKVEVEVFGDGHNYGKYVVTVEATETTPGVKTRTCKGCGKVETALLYATDAINAEAVATDASGNLADFVVENAKLTKSEKAALNALLQQDAYGSEIKISYETDGTVITNITYSIPVPAEYTDYENVRVVVRDDDGTIHFVDFTIEKGFIVFTF